MTDNDMDSSVTFFSYLAQAFSGDIDFGFLDESLNENDSEALLSGITQSDLVIFLLFSSSADKFDINNKLKEMMKIFSAGKKSLLVTNLNIEQKNAYTDTLILLSDLSDESLASAIVELSGKSIE